MRYSQPVSVDFEIRRATSQMSGRAKRYKYELAYYAGNKRNLNAVERSNKSTSD